MIAWSVQIKVDLYITIIKALLALAICDSHYNSTLVDIGDCGEKFYSRLITPAKKKKYFGYIVSTILFASHLRK